jgi:hypothetical protein
VGTVIDFQSPARENIAGKAAPRDLIDAYLLAVAANTQVIRTNWSKVAQDIQILQSIMRSTGRSD